MSDCLKEIGKSIITQCLWPPIKSHIDYLWCFDDNIQVLRDGVRDLGRETSDINARIEEARLNTDNLRSEVEEWSKAGTMKLAEASRILQDDINPKAWNLISRYSLGKRAKKAAEDIAKHRNDGKFNAIADPAPPPAMGLTPHRSTMDFESRKRIEEDIIKSLKESSVGMIGICGMGGIGKTTMAQRIRERVMKENLFDEAVMVVVSQQIDMLKIQEEIAEWLKLELDGRSISARADKLRTRLMDTKRKIIIFDDVWERLKLEDLGVPFQSGFATCKILLTTRSKDACSQMEVKKIFTMGILTEEEAWILFKEKAGDGVEDSTLFNVAKDVVAKCNGLPIALVTVGKALRDKKKSIWIDSLSQLNEANPADFPEVLADVYNPLKLSYDHLENERERLVFLLCCLFPEDYDIPVEELTLYFMGLRKFDRSPRSIEEARNRMDRLVEKLKSRFLLIDGGGKHHVKMHDVVRDVAIYIGSKKNVSLAKSVNKISIQNSSDINCIWMSVDVSNELMNVDMGLGFPKPRLLMLSSDISLEGIRDLNVLRVSYGPLPPTLGLLQNLRTLYLYRCKVEDISVIGELAGLEILYCYACGEIKELPEEIGRLNRLRLLDLNRCHKVQRIPFGILSSLVRLEELKIVGSFNGWEAEESGKEKRNASVRELESLTNLTCLEIEISDSNLAAQEICLSPKLVKYRIVIGFDNYWDEDRDNYEKVMNIYLPSETGAVGKWIQNLVKNTEYLFLEGNGSNSINLEECQDLRKLIVRYCSKLKKLVKTKDCIVFPMLERLKLECLDNLEEIWDGTIILNQNNVSCSLSNLKYLYIGRCSKLRYLLSASVATTCLLQLEVLVITKCPAMEQVFRNDITDHGCIEFPKLKTLSLQYLPNWTAFCLGIENIKFPNLTEMSIGYLPNLKSVCPLNSETPFHFVCNPKGDGSNNINIEECKDLRNLVVDNCSSLKKVVLTKDYKSGIVFPMFERLRLEFLNNLEEIWDGTIILNQNNLSSLSNLKYLNIDHCSKLRYLLPVSVATTCLLQLEVLDIRWCEAMEQVFRNDITDGCIEFPRLNKLRLQNLKSVVIEFCSKLRYFLSVSVATTCLLQLEELKIGNCKAMEQVFKNDITDGCIEFPKLKTLIINGCDKLRYLFSVSVATTCLLQLEFLRIEKCEAMEQVFRNDITDHGCIQFPKLKTLMINGCSKLRYLFSVSVATTCLLQLELLDIYDCEAMEQVFRNHDITDGCIEFPKLKTMILRNLPNLTAFCQGIDNINFPQLTIGHLPKLKSETPHDNRNPFRFLCNPKVEICGLKTLTVWSFFNNIRNIWSHQIPINFFNNIKNQNTSMIEDEDEDANKDKDKDDNKGYNNENVNKDENENEDADKDEDKDENNNKYNNENVNKEEDEAERK